MCEAANSEDRVQPPSSRVPFLRASTCSCALAHQHSVHRLSDLKKTAYTTDIHVADWQSVVKTDQRITDQVARFSSRESELIEMASRGMTDKQIAVQLDLSRDTIVSYWRRMFAKARVTSRPELIAKQSQWLANRRIAEAETRSENFQLELSRQAHLHEEDHARDRLVQDLNATSLAYIGGQVPRQTCYESLLNAALTLTQSTMGFVGEVTATKGVPCIRTLAVSWIEWPAALNGDFEITTSGEIVFRNFDVLWGRPVTAAAPIVENELAQGGNANCVPFGHTGVECFLGIPVIDEGKTIGVLCLANRPAGYDERVLSDLHPLVEALRRFIFRIRKVHDRQWLVTRLTRGIEVLQSIVDDLPGGVLLVSDDLDIELCEYAFPKAVQSDGFSELLDWEVMLQTERTHGGAGRGSGQLFRTHR